MEARSVVVAMRWEGVVANQNANSAHAKTRLPIQ